MQWLRLSRLYRIPRKTLQRMMDGEEFAEQLALDRLDEVMIAEQGKPNITESFVKQQTSMRNARHKSPKLNRRAS